MMQSFGDSFSDIKTRVKRHMRDEKINEYILGLVKSAYERAIDAQNAVISKPEKEILLKNVTKEILAEMLEQLKS
jgi:hypothetical protein